MRSRLVRVVCQIAAFEEAHAVAGECAQRGERLVEFVRDAGRQLADHSQFTGLDQFVLGGAQGALGADALGDLVLQQVVGGGKIGRAFIDLALQFVVRLLQRLLRGQPVFQVAAAFGEHQAEHEKQHGNNDGDGGAALRDIVDLFEVREDG